MPIDDDNTLSVGWFFNAVPKDRRSFAQNEVPCWRGRIRNDDGRWITSQVMNQDFVAWIGQGRLADRSKEHLGRSDRGVVMIRRRFLADLESIGRGEDPKAVVRDPAVNDCIELPIFDRDFFVDGWTREDLEDADQPAEVRAVYVEAMGFDADFRGR